MADSTQKQEMSLPSESQIALYVQTTRTLSNTGVAVYIQLLLLTLWAVALETNVYPHNLTVVLL